MHDIQFIQKNLSVSLHDKRFRPGIVLYDFARIRNADRAEKRQTDKFTQPKDKQKGLQAYLQPF